MNFIGAVGVAYICKWWRVFVEYFKEVCVLCLPFYEKGGDVCLELYGVGGVWEIYSIGGIVYGSFGG